MKRLVKKQIAAIVLDTLTRTMKIAKQQGATTKVGEHEVITLPVLEELHKSCANNLGDVLAEALEGDVSL